MSVEKPNFKWDFPVGASALSQYACCKTPSGAVVTAAVTDEAFGIIQDGADANASNATFVIFGCTKAIASAAISKGALLMPNAAGKVTTHDGDAASVHLGVALEAASGDGSEIEIFLYANKVQAQA